MCRGVNTGSQSGCSFILGLPCNCVNECSLWYCISKTVSSICKTVSKITYRECLRSASLDSACPLSEGRALHSVTKEVVGIHVLLSCPLFDGGIPRRLLLRVSLAKPTSAPSRFVNCGQSGSDLGGNFQCQRRTCASLRAMIDPTMPVSRSGIDL